MERQSLNHGATVRFLPRTTSIPNMRVILSMAVLLWAGTASADRDLHAGVNFRTDLGTHLTRVEVGARWGTVELSAVVDPASATQSQADQDLVATWWFAPERFAAFSGWRNTSYSLLGDVVWHEKLLTGGFAKLPSIGTDRLRFLIGVEVAAEVVRHGTPIATEWFDASSMRAVDDLVNVSLFGRAELALDF